VKLYIDNPPLALPAEHEPHWYAVYTCARHEKRIAEQFRQRSIEQFLPLYETVHRWKDRRVRVQLPIFPSYIFVRIALTQQLRVLQIPGVVRLVSFNGKPLALPEWEISTLQRGLSSGLRAEPYPYLATGRQVRIKAGPLCGLTGRIVRRKQNYRIVISVDSISRSIICEVSPEDVEAAGPTLARSAHTEMAQHRDQVDRPLPGEVVA
jgi:transcription antitermination factor NusG